MADSLTGVNLRPYYVAFLDVLGFTEMVNQDSKGSKQENLKKLFRCHQSASSIFRDDVECSIVQFSDSIVISMPYSAEKFVWFMKRVADYQRFLLDEHLVCRGGIAVNKHFSNGTFTFSAGLIDAYRVESKSARYPRVVVSKEVLDLVFPNGKKAPKQLIEEDDGLFFIDYIGMTKNKKPKHLIEAIEIVTRDLVDSTNASVKEKGVWLAAYSDSVLNTNFSRPRFIFNGTSAISKSSISD
ncbi:hypothetical protein CLV01_3467 [Delftia sp. 60]|uniref:hypothetical protein n=1 Tax=Delftia sp. 60 TaxID=2035216 RepID=UPI000C43CE8E|nr:hypothetical protein [Delftia sp. 60]PIF37757.1 hypothetical protein CLU98_2982 [Burkholderiales bacterium 23]PIF67062.1 hypothetical protein CLV01_3467 [Delftia sp. 60]